MSQPIQDGCALGEECSPARVGGIRFEVLFQSLEEPVGPLQIPSALLDELGLPHSDAHEAPRIRGGPGGGFGPLEDVFRFLQQTLAHQALEQIVPRQGFASRLAPCGELLRGGTKVLSGLGHATAFKLKEAEGEQQIRVGRPVLQMRRDPSPCFTPSLIRTGSAKKAEARPTVGLSSELLLAALEGSIGPPPQRHRPELSEEAQNHGLLPHASRSIGSRHPRGFGGRWPLESGGST